jgi:hypothetical protein
MITVDRDRDNPLGFGSNTYAAATINSCGEELEAYIGPQNHVKFDSHS